MMYLLGFSVFIAVIVLCWFAQLWLSRRYTLYQAAFKSQAHKDLSELFLFLDPAQVWTAGLVLCMGVSLGIYVFTGSAVLMVPAALLTLLAPRYGLARVRRRRWLHIDQQLPDFLLALAGALRSGAGIQTALRHIVDYMPAPLSQELALTLREQRIGVSLEQALEGLYRRVPTEGVSLVVSALRISAQSGGSLAETLERIATTQRARLHLLGRVRALTSQGRMQAWVMACLPIGLGAALHWLEPDAMALLWSTPAGWGVLLAVAVLESVGLFFIRRIVNIRV